MVASNIFFLLDMTIDNMFLIYLKKWNNVRRPRKPMIHLEFWIQLCEALTPHFQGKRDNIFKETTLQKKVYYKFLCLQKRCFVKYHDKLYKTIEYN